MEAEIERIGMAEMVQAAARSERGAAGTERSMPESVVAPPGAGNVSPGDVAAGPRRDARRNERRRVVYQGVDAAPEGITGRGRACRNGAETCGNPAA